MVNTVKKQFTIIPNELINDSTLDSRSRFLFVYLASKPDDWKYRNTDICNAMGCKEDSLRKYFLELKNKGWIDKIQVKGKNGTFNGYDIQLNSNVPVSEIIRDGKNPTLNNTNKYRNNNNKGNNKKEKELIDILSDSQNILIYLNTKKQSDYKIDNQKHLNRINALFKQGYTKQNLMDVIDASIVKWNDSDKNRMYIRPETLFGEKFDSYLVESKDILKNATTETIHWPTFIRTLNERGIDIKAVTDEQKDNIKEILRYFSKVELLNVIMYYYEIHKNNDKTTFTIQKVFSIATFQNYSAELKKQSIKQNKRNIE